MNANCADLKPDYFALACSVVIVSGLSVPMLIAILYAMGMPVVNVTGERVAITLVFAIPLIGTFALLAGIPLFLYASIIVRLTFHTARIYIPYNGFGSALYGAIMTLPSIVIFWPPFPFFYMSVFAGAVSGFLYFRFQSGHWLFTTRTGDANLA